MKLALALLCALAATLSAADQTGAESAKKPVAASIETKGPKDDADPIGNVKVTYEDGTTDSWTTKGNCGQAHVSSDGTVGWVIYEPEQKIRASYTVRPCREIVLCRKGKIVARLKSAQPFIEEWQFQKNGTQVAASAMFAHGPSFYTLYDAATGKVLAEAKSLDETIPAWAKPLHKDN
ncbi:MAG: hypothetical protein U1F71_15315 [Verrucomicrobiaceae bacterium]